MTNHSTITLIERRVSVNRFDSGYAIPEADVERLVQLATRAPTAYNLQNWRFIAARTEGAKARLRRAAHDQAKVSDAAVTFIVCGVLPDIAVMSDALTPFVNAGHMSADTLAAWRAAASAQYADSQDARDEVIRSASLGAATLIYAAEAMGFVSGPLGGFDVDGVAREFSLGANETPVMLVAVGRAAIGNWPQKPRRPLTDVLDVV